MGVSVDKLLIGNFSRRDIQKRNWSNSKISYFRKLLIWVYSRVILVYIWLFSNLLLSSYLATYINKSNRRLRHVVATQLPQSPPRLYSQPILHRQLTEPATTKLVNAQQSALETSQNNDRLESSNHRPASEFPRRRYESPQTLQPLRNAQPYQRLCGENP